MVPTVKAVCLRKCIRHRRKNSSLTRKITMMIKKTKNNDNPIEKAAYEKAMKVQEKLYYNRYTCVTCICNV